MNVYGVSIDNPLFLGTAQYPSIEILEACIVATHTQVLTVSVKNSCDIAGEGKFIRLLKKYPKILWLPNTAGCSSAEEAIEMALIGREIFQTNWVKLEVIGDAYTLQPDPILTVQAAKSLIAKGFEVFPFCTDDLLFCQSLINVGCKVLMPWASPIGSGLGILNPFNLKKIRDRFQVPLIVDAGIGSPSDALQVLEMGYDGILLNSAIAKSLNPVALARGFYHAVQAGIAYDTLDLMSKTQSAVASTPLIDTPFWHAKK